MGKFIQHHGISVHLPLHLYDQLIKYFLILLNLANAKCPTYRIFSTLNLTCFPCFDRPSQESNHGSSELLKVLSRICKTCPIFPVQVSRLFFRRRLSIFFILLKTQAAITKDIIIFKCR